MPSPSLVQSVTSHLEFLGYSFSKAANVLIGAHDSKPMIGISEFRSGILFTAVYATTPAARDDESGFIKFANQANTGSLSARFVVSNSEYLTVEAWFPDHYERKAFDDFFQGWLKEIDQFLKTEELSRKYLE
jgi:hypothetical protein